MTPHQYRLGINAGTEDPFPAFAVSLNSPVHLVVPDHLDQRIDIHAKSVQLVPRTATLVLDVTPVNRPGGDVMSYLEVKNLEFSQVQQIGSERPAERRVSTLHPARFIWSRSTAGSR